MDLKNYDLDGERIKGTQGNAGTAAPTPGYSGESRGLTPVREITSRELLAHRIVELRHEANAIDTLLRALPLELPYDAERVLVLILQRAIRERC